jgi:hypothetical protein
MNEHTIAMLREWARSHVTAVATACVLAAGLGLYVLTQHTAHVIGALPYALIVLCPLMHFMMPGGHGAHGSHSSHGSLEGSGWQGDHSVDIEQGSREARSGQDSAAQPRRESD